MNKRIKGSVWKWLDENPVIARMWVAAMAPTFSLAELEAYAMRSCAMCFGIAFVPRASEAFKRFAQKAYGGQIITELDDLDPEAVVVDYVEDPDDRHPQSFYRSNAAAALAACNNKAATLRAIQSGELNIDVIPGKRVVHWSLFVLVTFYMLIRYKKVYVQADTTQGGFATYVVDSLRSTLGLVRYQLWSKAKYYILAPYVEVVDAFGVCFFDGEEQIAAPTGNIRDPKDPHGSTVGTFAPLPLAMRQKFAHQFEQMESMAEQAASRLRRMLRGHALIAANVDFIIYRWKGQLRVAFQEYNARMTHFILIARALYGRLRVLGKGLPTFEQFVIDLSKGHNGYAVIGNDSIKVAKAKSFAEVLERLEALGIALFDGTDVGILPIRDYIEKGTYGVVGLVIAAHAGASEDALKLAAEKYIQIVTALGGDNAYHREVDAILRPDT